MDIMLKLQVAHHITGLEWTYQYMWSVLNKFLTRGLGDKECVETSAMYIWVCSDRSVFLWFQVYM